MKKIDELNDEEIREKNLFKRPQELPPAGEYEVVYVGSKPPPESWKDKSAFRHYFSLNYNKKEFFAGLIEPIKPRRYSLIALMFRLLADKEPDEDSDISKYTGNPIRISVKRCQATKSGLWFLKVTNFHPLF